MSEYFVLDAVRFMDTIDDDWGTRVGDAVGTLDSCNDGGIDKDAVGAGVRDDEKVSYKYTLPLLL